MDIEELAAETLNAAFAVHTALGPGLLESAYEACMIHELRKRGLRCESQVLQPIVYNGERIDAGYRLDILVEGILIVELKALDRLLPIHQAQTLTYLKLHGSTLGLLINFNVLHLKDGIQRVVLNHPTSPLRVPSRPSRLDTSTGLKVEPQRTPRDAKEDA